MEKSRFDSREPIQSKLTGELWFTYGLGGIIFVILSAMVFHRIYRFNPTLLKPENIDESQNHDTTYQWDLILQIASKCLGYAFGFVVLIGLIIFLLVGIWFIDTSGLIAIIFVMAYYVAREFDKFWRKYTRPTAT